MLCDGKKKEENKRWVEIAKRGEDGSEDMEDG